MSLGIHAHSAGYVDESAGNVPYRIPRQTVPPGEQIRIWFNI